MLTLIVYAYRIKDISDRKDGLIDFIRPQSVARRSNQEEIDSALGSEPDGPSFMTYANPNWLEASFYFRNITESNVDLRFDVEGSEPIWLSNITVHAHPDAVYRVFENGIVLANPSNHEYTFDLESITSGRKYRRLVGSFNQDPVTNNGSPVGRYVTLGPLDGLFLVSSLITSPTYESVMKSSTVTASRHLSYSLSAIDHYEIKLDEGAWINVKNNTSRFFSGLSDGMRTICVRAIDKMGNCYEDQISFIVKTSLFGEPGWIDDIEFLGGIIAALSVTSIALKKSRTIKRALGLLLHTLLKGRELL